jgi:TorA maturation chaperone TorD
MELFRALAIFAEPPASESARIAEALGLGQPPTESEYTETFLFQLYPYASVYRGAEGMMGGEARDLVAGFWRALGLVPPPEPDHLSVMLSFYAQLEEREREDSSRAEWRNARRAFLWEHLLSWLPLYLRKLEEIAAPFHQRWGEVLRQALREEVEAVGGQSQLPLHLRQSHALADPRQHGAEEFLRSLLAPARSGMIITRRDLARAARKVGLGLRLGERRFILRSLFNQDARGLLEWLTQEAARWLRHHERSVEMPEPIAGKWAERARATIKLLDELKASAQEEVD